MEIALVSQCKLNVPFGRLGMSGDSENVYSTATGMDYPAHEQQYKTFIKVGVIAAGAVATIVILMAIFLT